MNRTTPGKLDMFSPREGEEVEEQGGANWFHPVAGYEKVEDGVDGGRREELEEEKKQANRAEAGAKERKKKGG